MIGLNSYNYHYFKYETRQIEHEMFLSKKKLEHEMHLVGHHRSYVKSVAKISP